jgi:hypothetical protein
VGEEELAVDVTGGVTVPVTGVGVGVGLGVGFGAGGCGVGDGSGLGRRVGKITGGGIGSGTGPGLATLTGGGVLPGAERGRDWTSVFTVGSNCCPDAAAGPAAVFAGPPPDGPPRAARSLRLPGTTWRPTASTWDAAGELGSVSGRSATAGVPASEAGPAIAIICGAPGGAPGWLPRPMYAAARKRLAAITATMDVFIPIPPDAVKTTPIPTELPANGTGRTIRKF